MLVRAPLVEAEQDGSIRIQDLTKVVMARRRLGLAKERLVPFEAARNVAYADDRPCAFHRISAVGLTRIRPNNCVFKGVIFGSNPVRCDCAVLVFAGLASGPGVSFV